MNCWSDSERRIQKKIKKIKKKEHWEIVSLIRIQTDRGNEYSNVSELI